ncbi:hypothetical protein [Trinickia mobilis]|nr:hypothetical protein [Trinickia mobilis]
MPTFIVSTLNVTLDQQQTHEIAEAITQSQRERTGAPVFFEK